MGVDNKKHPELLKNEIFFANISEESFKTCNWQTKRKGKSAYDIRGRHLPRIIPLFIKISELKAIGGLDPKTNGFREHGRKLDKNSAISFFKAINPKN